MGYEEAIKKSWAGLQSRKSDAGIMVRFLSEKYKVDLPNKTVMSLESGRIPEDRLLIILLHYAAAIDNYRHDPAGEKISFWRLPGGEVYAAVYRKRTIERLLRKISGNEMLRSLLKRTYPTAGDIQNEYGFALDVLDGVRIYLKYEPGDDEFRHDLNIFYDAGLTKLFCTEDIIVLTELVIKEMENQG